MMTTRQVMSMTVVAAAVALSACGTLSGAPPRECAVYLDDLHHELKATGLDPLAPDKFPPSRFLRNFPNHEDPNKVLKGREGHTHTVADLDAMRRHLLAAKDLCGQGDEHAALLHMDVVRALHKLPEIQHPQDHPSSSQTP